MAEVCGLSSRKCFWLSAKEYGNLDRTQVVTTTPTHSKLRELPRDVWHLRKLQLAPFRGPGAPEAPVPLQAPPAGLLGVLLPREADTWRPPEAAEAHQLWKLCTAVCFWESRRSSSRIALMSEAEEWPGCRSSAESAA